MATKFNIEAERSVLGAVLLEPSRVDDVFDVVAPDDFFHKAHRKIARAMVAFRDRDVPIDAYSVMAELKHRRAEQVLQTVPLTELADAGMPRTAMRYAALVRGFSELCAVELAGRGIAQTAAELSPREYAEVESFKDQAEERIFGACERGAPSTVKTAAELVDSARERFAACAEHRAPPGVVLTGFSTLDVLTGGLHPGALVVVAARPSMGKSAFLSQVSESCATSGRAVALLSLEMSGEELIERVACGRSEINLTKAKAGNLNQAERRRLDDALDEVRTVPILVDDEADQYLASIRSKSRRLARGGQLGVVLIDYLQLIRPRDVRDPRERQIAEISHGLKALAKQLHVPVIAAAQLNRLVESRQGHRPQLSDLRESGTIEQTRTLSSYFTAPSSTIRKIGRARWT